MDNNNLFQGATLSPNTCFNYDQQPMSNNNGNNQPINNCSHNYQQYTPNGNFNNNVTNAPDQQYNISNDIPQYTYQQYASDNVSSPPLYHNQNPPNPPQSNIPRLNPFNINITSPQTTIINMSVSCSDIQNLLQKVNTHLNHHSSSTNNLHTQFQ